MSCVPMAERKDDPNMTPERLTEIRYKEQEDAAKYLALRLLNIWVILTHI